MFYKLFIIFLFWGVQQFIYAQATLQQQIRTIITGKNAKIGVAVLYNGQELLTVNNDETYPLLSTFKFPVALAVLHRLDEQNLPLNTALWITPEDLKPDTYSPLRDFRPEGNFYMTIEELLKYCVSQSDNNACDILIQYSGGPRKIQKYIRQLGIQGMKIVATEDDMHKKIDYQYLNRAQPSTAVLLLEKFMEKKLFAPVYQELLEKIMIETTTGTNKLKGLLPSQVIIGHKTGSSDRNAAGLKIADNDMGFVYLPDGKHYTIAVFVMDSLEDDQTNAAIIARISKVVYDYYRNQY